METTGGQDRDPVHRERLAEAERVTCPRCGSLDVRRSHTEGLAAGLLRIFGRWPFRCRSCRSRFYRSTPPRERA